MPVEARAQTLAHLRLVAGLPGFWELRALQRQGGATMAARGSFFIIATTTAEGALLYDRLEQAVDWADAQDRAGAEVFIGMNPREREARSKAAVAVVTACYVDLDLSDGESQETALAAVTDGDAPLPSFVVNSGYGLHVVYLLRVPSRDKATWTRTQKALARRYSALGADPKVAGDESRVLRLVPYPNRKMSPDGVPTSIVYESEYRYELAELARALAPEQGTPFSRREVVAFTPPAFHIEEPEDSPAAEGLTAEGMQRLVDRMDGARAILEQWIRRSMTPGLHYGIIPLDGQPPSKPTLLKPGAELVALLYGWKFHFVADLDSLQMYGPAAGGTFAYICYLIDGQGRTVGQGRGMAELREPQMLNANKAVKMALKRAQVDAVLRCAGLSQWFTQDLEEPRYIAPGAAATDNAPAGTPQTPDTAETPRPPPAGRYRQYLRERMAAQDQAEGDARAGASQTTPPPCTPQQQHLLRRWLQRTGRSEEEILRHYRLTRLEELPALTATRILERLIRLDHDARQGRRRDGGEAGAR